MARHTDFGKTVLKRLVDLDRTSSWLVHQVMVRTGKYFDSAMLSKMLSGKMKRRRFAEAIAEILEIPIKYGIRYAAGGFSEGFTEDELKAEMAIPAAEHPYGGVVEFWPMTD